ncbi:MAG TPA: hypothetical protein VMU54_13330 [Planctomycetota bacterium]|nr:hypothetical protein [Planctomycetota bacterium]
MPKHQDSCASSWAAIGLMELGREDAVGKEMIGSVRKILRCGTLDESDRAKAVLIKPGIPAGAMRFRSR